MEDIIHTDKTVKQEIDSLNFYMQIFLAEQLYILNTYALGAHGQSESKDLYFKMYNKVFLVCCSPFQAVLSFH